MHQTRGNTMSKRKRNKSNRFNYGRLEARQLLATFGEAQFDGDATIDSGLIENGNFDATDVAEGAAVRINANTVDGWNATLPSSELVSLVGFNDSPRNTVLHLDVDAESVESIFQVIDTDFEQQYVLTFDLRGRTADSTADASTNDIEVSWGGNSLGTFRGDVFWQTFTLTVSGASGDSTRLQLNEVDGAGNDGLGALVDNVRLIKVTDSLVTNGSFETNASGSVNISDVDGWAMVGPEEGRILDVVTGDASDGSQYVNLDGSDERTDVLIADIATENGGVYFVSFDIRSDSGTSSASEEVRVQWNGDWAGTFRGQSDWTNVGFTVTADSDTTQLIFREPGDGNTGDGAGPQLDNVRIIRVDADVNVESTGTTNFTFEESDTQPITIGAGLDVAPVIVGSDVEGITVRLSDEATFESEVLAVDVGTTGITPSYDSSNGTLSLTGPATAAQFTQVLRTLTYQHTSNNRVDGVRNISVFANDSESTFLTVDVGGVTGNEDPTITPIVDATATAGTEFVQQVTAADPEGGTLTYDVTFTGTAVEAGDATPSIDSNGRLTWTPSRSGDLAITVTATDPANNVATEEFAVAVAAVVNAPVTILSGSDLPVFDSNAATDVAVGSTVPLFEASTINGQDFESESENARVYGFFTHWCPACQGELPEIVEYLEDNPLPDGVEYVAVSVDTRPTQDNFPPGEWFVREGFENTVVVDSSDNDLLSAFGVSSYPFLVAVDADGTVVERVSGRLADGQLQDIIDSVTPT